MSVNLMGPVQAMMDGQCCDDEIVWCHTMYTNSVFWSYEMIFAWKQRWIPGWWPGQELGIQSDMPGDLT